MSYVWTFGDGSTSTLPNPTKTYTATGTYIVKLRATGPGGIDSMTRTVNVLGNPPHGFTINDSVQNLTGNSFTFTSTTPTFGNLYTWTFGDGSTSTLANPSRTYSVAGVYTVTQSVVGNGGCTVPTSKIVVVESDGVGGGSGGGLESESMGDLISRREYLKIKNSIPAKPNYAALPLFVKPSQLELAAKGTQNASTLQRFIPANLDATTTPRITSPEELKTITRAVDAFAVDYTKNDVARAVVLGITTEGKAYNHTKSICDRFRGAELVSTNVVNIGGYNFVEFALKQADGHVEHSITFAVGKSAGRSTYKLQAKWLISEYTGDDSVFNFQVWATNPNNLHKLTTDILNQIKAEMPVEQAEPNLAPSTTYMAKGVRNKEYLNVNFVAATASNNAKFVFIQKLNEVANEDSLIIPFNLAAGADNQFSIPIYDGYEYEGHLYVDDNLVDDVYLADGGWSLDIDKTYTTQINFKPNNNKNRVYNDEEFPLYRSVQVNAFTNDYISIYKFLKAGQEAADMTAYHSYKLHAKGTGKMTIRLIKKSVTKFAEQYQATIELNPAGANHQISFEDFTSPSLKAAFDPKDVTAVVYTFEMNGVATDLNFFADEQAFSPTMVQAVKGLVAKNLSVFPNPTADGKFQLKFAAEADRDMDLTITDITGKLVYTQPVKATMGYNKVDVQLPAGVPQSVLLVQLGNEQVKYDVVKMSSLK
jgi:PKD repeat protein